jgi:hypothetical protein
VFRHAGHLGDSAGVVSHRAVGVDRQRDDQCAQHAERGNCYTVHAGQHPRNVDGKADREIRADGALVTECQSENDVGRGTGLAGLGHFTNGAVGI